MDETTWAEDDLITVMLVMDGKPGEKRGKRRRAWRLVQKGIY
jgi:hypothetical protein